MLFLAVNHDHPLLVDHPGKACTEHSKVSVMLYVGKSVATIPAYTHKIQIWPLTSFGKHKQHIKILLKVMAKNNLPEMSKCILTVGLLFQDIKELKVLSNIVAQLNVPFNLSQLGIKTTIKYLHNAHYIKEPTLKNMTRLQVSQFCYKQLDAKDFTYFSQKELREISKYFNLDHGLIFSGAKMGKKVLYLCSYISVCLILKCNKFKKLFI